jgi:hypothetical protein
VTVTYDLTRLQRLDTSTRYLVTLGGTDLVDPDTVLDTMEYEHPAYTPASVAAQRRLPECDSDRVVLAGAYHGWGFHEDGARSGLAAAGPSTPRGPASSCRCRHGADASPDTRPENSRDPRHGLPCPPSHGGRRDPGGSQGVFFGRRTMTKQQHRRSTAATIVLAFASGLLAAQFVTLVGIVAATGSAVPGRALLMALTTTAGLGALVGLSATFRKTRHLLRVRPLITA